MYLWIIFSPLLFDWITSVFILLDQETTNQQLSRHDNVFIIKIKQFIKKKSMIVQYFLPNVVDR